MTRQRQPLVKRTSYEAGDMADVRLDFYDLDAEVLPDICMQCGAPATVRPNKTFTWLPDWAGFLGIIGTAFMKRRRAPTPLCDRHKNHWTIRYIVRVGGMGLFFLLLLGGALVMVVSDGEGVGALFGEWLLAGAGLTFVVWLIPAIILNFTAIKVVEITDDAIVLKNVSAEFAQTYREQTAGGFAPEVERIAREPFGQPGSRRPREDDEPRRGKRDDYPPDDKVRR
jgi:hypothetical protein